ncbi:hypothetical protein BGZ51_001494 [Haplosporangium sp. Z 767]|nr:hypothetical protein BGZ51_001494 [Haplosporangium sp. Z 767]KAF9196144.1 hypothetical protein BGZ50_001840 [Haplosporangium sp. Z 11]
MADPGPLRVSERIRERKLLREAREVKESAENEREQQRLAHERLMATHRAKLVKKRVIAKPRSSGGRPPQPPNKERVRTKKEDHPDSLTPVAGIKRKVKEESIYQSTNESQTEDERSDPDSWQEDTSDSEFEDETPRKRIKTESQVRVRAGRGKSKTRGGRAHTSRRKLVTSRTQTTPHPLQLNVLNQSDHSTTRASLGNEILLPILSMFGSRQIMPTKDYIQSIYANMAQAFQHARAHYNTPLSAVIYWMPRIAPGNSAAKFMTDGNIQYWRIPVKQCDQPYQTAPIIRYIRTDQVAHWLHLSTQEFVGFLSLCTVEEAYALNLYLCFRLEMMRYIQGLPMCFHWLFTNVQPSRGDHVYELLLKFRTLDDDHQRKLSWVLHGLIRRRRNIHDHSAFPRNASIQFVDKDHRANFEYLHKIWRLHRAKRCPTLDWNSRSHFPDFADMRSLSRWYLVEDPPLSILTNHQVRQVIDSDMSYLVKCETERNHYLLGEMFMDELRFSTLRQRYAFACKNVEDIIPSLNMKYPWRSDLDAILQWHKGNRSPTMAQVEDQLLRDAQNAMMQQQAINVQQQQVQQQQIPSPSPSVVSDHTESGYDGDNDA